MSSKKRSRNSKTRSGRQLSGNPQRRTEQLRAKQDRDVEPLPTIPFAALTGAPEPAPWWAASHERILQRVRTLDLPTTPGALDAATCELVGSEYLDCVERHEFGGHAQPWLRTLVEAAEQAVRNGVDSGAWRGPWMLLQGITAWAPGAGGEHAPQSPYGAALRAIRRLTKTLSARGHLSGDRHQHAEPAGPRVAGDPLVLRNVYGSRAALLAPFSYSVGDGTDARADPHWYCWDVDQCSLDYVTGAAVFGSVDEALDEWRRAVGPTAPADATPVPCGAQEAGELLSSQLATLPFADMRRGDEPRELMVEWFRLQRRAQDTAAYLGIDPAPRASEPPHDQLEDFRAWYAARNGAKPEFDDVAALADDWGPLSCTPPLLHACPPHRIAMATVLVNDGIVEEYVPGIMRLMPEWVEWCIERTGLDGEPAERARAEAHRAVHARRPAGGWDEWERGPFRRVE